MKMFVQTKQEESSDVHRIKLEPEQASKVPFPPGCQVVVFEKSKLSCSGEVNAVYVSFSHDSGSCDNCYEVFIRDVKGAKVTLVARGDQLRYGIDCPIYITAPSGSGVDANEAIEGVIKGFELQPEDSNNCDGNGKETSAFLYTVEVSAAVHDGQERLFRQRGISPEHIRFRPVAKTSSYLQDDRTTIVSFDDVSATYANGKSENAPAPFPQSDPQQTPNEVRSEKVVYSSPVEEHQCVPSPHFRPPHMNNMYSPRAPPSFQRPSQQCEKVFFARCTPLRSPIPNHFQGNMAESRNEKVPDFTFLVNYPICSKNDYPAGKRRCVMCGEVRATSAGTKGGKAKNDSAPFIPNQNKGLCTTCDVGIWEVNESKMQIKWCKGCKNFQTWASFGEKGSATKCMRCRERQREKYALSKNAKSGKVAGNKRKSLQATESTLTTKPRTSDEE